jgi:hypothetical protein
MVDWLTRRLTGRASGLGLIGHRDVMMVAGKTSSSSPMKCRWLAGGRLDQDGHIGVGVRALGGMAQPSPSVAVFGGDVVMRDLGD